MHKTSYKHMYIENKAIYSVIRTKYIQHMTGCGQHKNYDNYKEWLPNLWGNEVIAEHMQIKEVINKPNSDTIVKNNSPIQLSFVVETWKNHSTDINDRSMPLKDILSNRKQLKEYFKSQAWQSFLDYTFKIINVTDFPFYTREIYHIDNIVTDLQSIGELLIIVISGIIKKYTTDSIQKLYDEDKALNKTLDLSKTEKVTKLHDIYEHITDAFYNSSEEGEMKVNSKLGKLSLGIHTHMKLEFTI